MGHFEALYRDRLGLLTDLYQLTMAAAAWRVGRQGQEGVFSLFFRNKPFGGGYALACGVGDAVEWLARARFEKDDVEYLRGLTGADGAALFDEGFLGELARFRFTVDVEAMPEGTVCFPMEPLLRVRGPVWQCQLAETALLTILNFQTLIATKSARICDAAAGDPVVEFGLRRVHGVDGGVSASRAAYVGGCVATSNVLAGKLLGIPVRGTHAHSWVMSFASEHEAFEKYAEAMPGNVVLLVDTYDTLRGVKMAAEVGKAMKRKGERMLGIRLDSGDLAYLSIEARKILDAAGLEDASIVASNDLDEHTIASLKQQGARIDTWGVGTKLVTAFDQPALGGVYKLCALKGEDGQWVRTVKRSEHLHKASVPGVLNVRRFWERDADGGEIAVMDAIFDEMSGCPERPTVVDPKDPTRVRRAPEGGRWEDVLKPVMRGGERVGGGETLSAVRARAMAQVRSLHPTIRRFLNPHAYPAGLEEGLHGMRMEMMKRRGGEE